MSAEAAQCPRCGKPLTDKSKVLRCLACGKYILKSDTSCRHCGAGLAFPGKSPAAPSGAPAAASPAPAPRDAAHENLDTVRAAHDEAELRAAEETPEREPMDPERRRQLLGVALAVLAVLLLAGSFLADLEGAKKRGYDTGYDEGFREGSLAGYSTGYDDGQTRSSARTGAGRPQK